MREYSTDLRTAYIDALIAEGEANPDVVVLDSDLAASTGTARFAARFPDRFYDCGIQEANMVGVAGGLSAMGAIPVIHSFAAFLGRRVVDQIFLSCAYAGLNVRLVGADPGICAAKNGGTHMSLEDLGILRTIPSLTLIDAADAVSLTALLHQSIETPGVYYFRLNRKATRQLYDAGANIQIGRANKLMEGSDVTLIAEGTVCVPEALDAAELLAREGIRARVLDMATIKPLDEAAVLDAARETGGILTIENHNIIGGLGSAVAEVLAGQAQVPFARIGVPDVFGQVGTQDELLHLFGLDAKSIAEKARALLAGK